MKKIIALACCLLLAAALAPGCAAQTFTAQHYTADPAQVKALRIDVRDRQIEVVPAQDGQITLTYSTSEKEGYEIAQQEGELVLSSRSDKQWQDYIGAKAPLEDRTIRIALPQEGLEGLTLSTTNADICLPALAAGSLTLSNNNGNITFEKLQVGQSLALEVRDGDISGTLAGGFDDFAIATQVKKGECNLPEEKEGGDKSLLASANNGDITIDFD
ncbi:DUF4097 family beta strand repeat protein [Christensenellaceae bacterium NSJ-44]|uniref:DUF4097 family beta strand repeat protein n=1 Tax=Luoshenia tenuis TaxID=2763654 RepID=A0A926D140_9FIRM|nr:DUF4097 family beta strand repeat-containing protein [Luoshenia tenuis]MBC8529823.1 DUF4097 family beta strand repeat protein [Luoshenia tenuis]